MSCFISLHEIVSQEVASFMQYYFSVDTDLIMQGHCRKVVCNLLLGISFPPKSLYNPVFLLQGFTYSIYFVYEDLLM